MYLAVLDFLNVWLGDSTIQLRRFTGNLIIKSSKSRTHLFLNKFDLASYTYCVYRFTYVCAYVYNIYICIASRTIHLQFKNKINTTRSSLRRRRRRYSCYSYCFCVVNWVTHLLQNFYQIISYTHTHAHTQRAHTHTRTAHSLIKYKHLCKYRCCFYFRASATFKTISNQKCSTYRSRGMINVIDCRCLLKIPESSKILSKCNKQIP